MPSNPIPFDYGSSFPKDLQLVDTNGQIMGAWQYFLLALWLKTGNIHSSVNTSLSLVGTTITAPASAGVRAVTAGPVPASTANAFNVIDAYGNVVGTIPAAPPSPSAERVLSVGTSPFTYTAGVNGLLTVSAGQVKLARSGPFYPVSMMGGQFVMCAGDKVEIIYFGAVPEVVWWPGGF